MSGSTSTPPPTRRRRLVGLLGGGLLAASLPLVAGASVPAAAAPGCLDETYSYTAPAPFELLPVGCDDTVAPETAVSAVAPVPTPAGYLRTTSFTVTFGGAHTDADTGVLGFECQLYAATTAPTSWETCTSPATYTGLSDTADVPYTFRVRAVDTADAAIAACDASPDLLNPTCSGEEPLAPGADDVDASPASVAVRVDTTAPNTFLDRLPVDRIRPDRPVVLTSTPVLEVNSNEAAGFECTVNGAALSPCGPGAFTVQGLEPGENMVVVRAVDAAANTDPTPATARLFLPSDLERSKGSRWRTVRKAGLFGGDYVEARAVGATLVVSKVRKVREVRLIAPVGPRFGTIEVRVGSSQWYTVDLHAKKRRVAQLLVRDEFSPLQSGTIQIRVASLRGPGSSVRLDAYVARG
jgi:hypothetical protein